MLPLDSSATMSPVGMLWPSIPEISGADPGRDQNVGQLDPKFEQLSCERWGGTVGSNHCGMPPTFLHCPGGPMHGPSGLMSGWKRELAMVGGMLATFPGGRARTVAEVVTVVVGMPSTPIRKFGTTCVIVTCMQL